MRPSAESILDTIAALATPIGRSAIALVRISGERTREILSRVARELPNPVEPRRPYLVGLTDLHGEPIDRGFVTLFPAPASFTGEDVAELSSRLTGARENLLAAAASLAATIDFSEDVGEAVDPSVPLHLTAARDSLARLAATYDRGRLLSAGCRVAILGRVNAGKSTLFNALLGTARAIVTEIPGTTRDTIEATIDVRGIPVELVDTAGLRETDDHVEKLGVERAREEGKTAAEILYVFDASAGWAEEDAAVLAALDGKPVAVVANKIDRLEAPDRPGVTRLEPAGAAR